MKLYIVEEDQEGYWDLIGVFSSYEKARAIIPDGQFYERGVTKLYPWSARMITEVTLDQIRELR